MHKRSYQHPHNEDGLFQKQWDFSIQVDSPEEKYEIFKTCSINHKNDIKIS